MYKFIVMVCGYVESSQTSWVIWGLQQQSSFGYANRAEAISELALDLYAKYFERHGGDTAKACCQANKKQPKAKFCATCGSKLGKAAFDAEGFCNFITDIHSQTCDDYGNSDWANERDLIWWPYCFREFRDADKDSIIWIVEKAETVLLDALGDAKPELEILNERGEWDQDWKTYFKKGKQPSYT